MPDEGGPQTEAKRLAEQQAKQQQQPTAAATTAPAAPAPTSPWGNTAPPAPTASPWGGSTQDSPWSGRSGEFTGYAGGNVRPQTGYQPTSGYGWQQQPWSPWGESGGGYGGQQQQPWRPQAEPPRVYGGYSGGIMAGPYGQSAFDPSNPYGQNYQGSAGRGGYGYGGQQPSMTTNFGNGQYGNTPSYGGTQDQFYGNSGGGYTYPGFAGIQARMPQGQSLYSLLMQRQMQRGY